MEPALTAIPSFWRSPQGDVAQLLAVAGSVRERLATAGVGAGLVRGRALADALAMSWAPGRTEHHAQDLAGGGDTLTLTYSPGFAKVTTPRYGALPEGAHGQPLPGAPPAALPRRDGKALPR